MRLSLPFILNRNWFRDLTEVNFTTEGMADIRNDCLLSINKDTEKHVPKLIVIDIILLLKSNFG